MYKIGYLTFYHNMSVRKRRKGSRIDVEYLLVTGLMLLDKPYPVLFFVC